MSEKRWLPLKLPRAANVTAAVALLGPAWHPRYQPELGETYCNIFAWDVANLLDVPLPHWVGQDGAPCEVGRGRELSANGLCLWLNTVGPSYGWAKAGAAEAWAAAQRGALVVATHENPGGHGHIAVVLPHADALRVAQAGKRCFADGPIARGFGSKPVAFFVHAVESA